MMTGSAGWLLLDLAEQLDARAARHADVGHQHLRLVVVERGQHVARVGEAAHRELLARQRLLEHEADRLVVVDDPDGFHAQPVSRDLAIGCAGRRPPGIRSGQRNHDLEHRPARLALAFDRALVLLHEGLRQRQPQSRSAFAPRHQREEDAIADRLGHARAVVLDMQFQCQSVALLAERDLARDARAQRDARVAGRDALGRAPAPRCARC